ncbi:hypothetical protein DUNSADRAFT_7446 [Dunaliella salina]|uniref:Encoded protein n=1 Tax=Dunaliella salina TaxID=3046 RepID=A0ABQ7GLF5_DUNSA|nr:hypothetical protein DUNSADRAFT_7446 [Dunaliella salina]|eukprot:KAF5835411.1 hypothetical protein DUNSADRAFT_7446 [Dunaliella salina]
MSPTTNKPSIACYHTEPVKLTPQVLLSLQGTNGSIKLQQRLFTPTHCGKCKVNEHCIRGTGKRGKRLWDTIVPGSLPATGHCRHCCWKAGRHPSMPPSSSSAYSAW